MKFNLVILTVLVAISTVSLEVVQNENDCKCWEDFKPEKEDHGYFCRSVKNYRIFACNEEQPPICRCLQDGKLIDLGLGYTDCLSVKGGGRWCENRDVWEKYFAKHPEHAILD